MQTKNVLAAGVSLATLGLLFGPSAGHAATLDPTVVDSAHFESVIVPNDVQQQQQQQQIKPAVISMVTKPVSLVALANSLV